MFKNFIMKQMLKQQMKHLPQDQQDKILKMIDEHPDFFEKVAGDVKKKMDGGMDQNTATMAVMRENQEQLGKMMGK